MATNVLCTVCNNIFDEVFAYIGQLSSLEIPIRPNERMETKFWTLAEWESSALSSTCHLCVMF